MGAWFFHAWGIIQGSSLLPRPDSDAALFVFLGIIGLLIAGYILGSSVARLVPPFAGPLFPQLSQPLKHLRRWLDGTADALSFGKSIVRATEIFGAKLPRNICGCESYASKHL